MFLAAVKTPTSRQWESLVTGCPSFSQIETFVEMSVSLRIPDDYTKLI